MATHPAANPLIGTWSMIAWYNEDADGNRFYPLGEDATGYISYAPDGFVFVHLAAKNRVHYALPDPFGGSVAEDSAALKSQITYAGPYTFHGDHVVHHVTQSSFPNWVGGDQVRQVTFTDFGMRLSAAGARFQGVEVTAYVDWERATV